MWACIIWGHSKTPLQLPKLEQNWYLSQHITCLESIISHGRVMKGCSIWPLAFMIRFSAGQNLIIQGAFVWTSSLFGIHWALRALLFEQCAGSACSRQSSSVMSVPHFPLLPPPRRHKRSFAASNTVHNQSRVLIANRHHGINVPPCRCIPAKLARPLQSGGELTSEEAHFFSLLIRPQATIEQWSNYVL